METDSSIRMKCPSCGVAARGKDSYLNREIKCPKCGKVVRFIRVDSPQAPSPHPVRDAHANVVHEKEDPRKTVDADVMRPAENIGINAFDTYLKIAAWVAGGGLLLLALSPFFKWITIGSGGVIGISGDGKIVLGVTVLAIAAYVAAIVKGKWFTPVFLGVQAWGTLAVFWMGALLWKVGSVLDSADMKDNPLFAAMFSTRLISPGAGLYLGLIGGIAVAGALGFVGVRHLLLAGNLKPFYASQGLSCLLGILLAVSVGPDRSPESNDATLGSLFSSQTKEENIIDAQLGETFVIGNLEITPKTIELVTLRERSMFGDPKPRKSKSYVLTFVGRNISEGQVFKAYSISSVVDNFANECSDPTDSTSFSSVRIEGNEEFKEISPGKSATVMVAFDPALKSAKEYTWTIRTKISNQDDYEKWRIRFSPKEVLVETDTTALPHLGPLTTGTAKDIRESNDAALGSSFSSQTKEENVIDTQLGETFALGNLEITPKTIELVTLRECFMFGDPKLRKSKSYVLTFIARNISEGQVFSAFSGSSVVDNFGNECSDPTDSTSFSSVQIEGNEELEDIGPGESATVMVAFDPALKSVKEYTWTIWTKISNRDDYEKWRIRFSPKEIQVE